ncbi:centrosome-associated protein Alms1a [Drosophila kikkawai]|uniref:Centrosome-associated protein Alms1a n=1 Tax=Drosophila kikkawai TaxID=30033 RepID=A0A6P4HZZ1_DROKI|nr:Alstrom syndrome protein 1 homolog a [Drosophila kikkawai]
MSSCGSRQRKTAKSSRIPPQAREYISEMAEDRELERFMALSSTASSGASGSIHTCAVRVSLATETAAISRPGARRPRSKDCQTVAKQADGAAEEALLQLPASPTDQQQPAKPAKSQESSPAADSYRIIPIVMVDDQSKSRPAAATQTMSLSVEDLRTPTKQPTEMHTKKTQTPESALKSHKRLEWDPAADVGYYKRAVSTSNISTLERSVLEECGWRQPMRSETDLDRLQRRESDEKAGTPIEEKTTVPLASSTMVGRQVASAGVSRKADSYSSSRGEVSNGSSRGEPFNSSSKGEILPSSSKEGEVLPSSSRRKAPPGSYKSVASKNSFNRKDSHSSSRKETTSLGSSSKKETPCSNSSKKELRTSSSLEALQAQVSSRRESLVSNPQAASRLSSRAENSQSSSRLGSEMSSRRESQGTSLYGSSAASSFDYHINMEQEQEWLKSLQKQQQEEQQKEPHKEAKGGEKDQRQAEPKNRDQKKAEQREKQRQQERQFTAAQFERILGSRRLENKENHRPESTSTSVSSQHAAAGHKRDLDLGIDLLCSLVEARSLSQGQKKSLVRDIARRIACLDLAESSSTASSRRERATKPVTVTASLQRQDVATNTSLAGSLSSSSPQVVTLPVPAPRKRNVDGTPSPLHSSSMSASTSASNEVITQKTNIPTRDAASTDADVDVDADAAIRDALTPMTQSEIEYEERMKAGMDPERRSQLNWIEAEIERLQSLKVFLEEVEENQPKAADEELIEAEPQEPEEKEQEQEREPKEGSGCKARQLAKAVQTEELQEDATPKPPVRLESVRVPPRIAGDVQAPQPPPHRYPRTKMATPVLASHSSSSGRSESVSSFVQQRHRRFREHYQNQQQQQLLLLKQQQMQSLQQQYKQQQQQQQQLCQLKHQPRVVIVHEEQHIVCESHRPQRQQQEYIQMMQYDQTVASGSAYATPHSSASGADNERERAIYYQVVNSPGASGSYVQAEPVAATTSSGSSMMCLSSEMSIPMGRVNTCETTTTTTTTHQYDDVACQRRKRRGGGEERMQRQTLQVRPSGIAYVIQFSASDSGGEVMPETRSLQDQLQLARPEFCAKSKQRKAILNQMQMMRNLRRREMDELVAENNFSLETLDRRLRMQLPPPATSRLRVFTTKEMKAMTSRKCQRLPEVLDAANRELEMRRRRNNRLMRDIFNKRMRNRVSNGQVSLNHSRTII